MRKEQYNAVAVRLAMIRATIEDAEVSLRRLASDEEGVRATDTLLSAGGSLIEAQAHGSLQKARRQLTELSEEYESAKRQAGFYDE